MQSYDFIELWAGKGMTTSVIRKSGRGTAALDIEYFQKDPEAPRRSNHYDILTPAGLAYRGLTSSVHTCTDELNFLVLWR